MDRHRYIHIEYNMKCKLSHMIAMYYELLDIHGVSMIGPAFPTIEQHKKQPTPKDSWEMVAFQLA